mgnify:CR=1 FL=1
MNEKYLIVDLDDSLISWDISFLSLFLALRKKPLLLFKLPFWIISKKNRPALAVVARDIGNTTYKPRPNKISSSNLMNREAKLITLDCFRIR